jgi:hypothetical protein
VDEVSGSTFVRSKFLSAVKARDDARKRRFDDDVGGWECLLVQEP